MSETTNDRPTCNLGVKSGAAVRVPGGVITIASSYTATMEDAEQRLKRGERQVYCGACGKWVWPDNVCPEHSDKTITSEKFWADAKEVQKQADAERGVADRAVKRFRAKQRRLQ